MASLSQNDHNIIAEHPLNSTLDHLRDLLRNTEKSCEVVDHDFDQGLQKAILELLGILLLSEPADYLPSLTGNRHVAYDLLWLRQRIWEGKFNYQLYRSLSHSLSSKKHLMSISGTLSSNSSSLSLKIPRLQTFLSFSMTLPSRLHPPASKFANGEKQESSKRYKNAHIGTLEDSSLSILRKKTGLNRLRKFIEPCKIDI